MRTYQLASLCRGLNVGNKETSEPAGRAADVNEVSML